MNIFHAGGRIDGNDYTNSRDAVLFHIQNDPNNNMFEIDVLKIKDSFIMAHDGKEKLYDYHGNFANITFDDFNKLKVYNKYTPLNFDILRDIVTQHPNAVFNLDIKEKGNKYNEAIEFIISSYSDITHAMIPQIYEIDDLLECHRREFKSCIVGMWKFHDDIYSNTDKLFITGVQKVATELGVTILGFSIDFKHNGKHFDEIKQLISSPIIFHGQGELDEVELKSYNDKDEYFFI